MILKHKGSYDILHPSEKQWVVTVPLPDDAPEPWLKETWDEDDEPDIDGLPPSEVVELISQRLDSYWISSKREDKRTVIQWVRDNAERLDAEWAAKEIEALERKIASLQARVESLRDCHSVALAEE